MVGGGSVGSDCAYDADSRDRLNFATVRVEEPRGSIFNRGSIRVPEGDLTESTSPSLPPQHSRIERRPGRENRILSTRKRS